MAITADELEVLRPYADRVHIREAFMVRFHPQWIDVREHMRGGTHRRPALHAGRVQLLQRRRRQHPQPAGRPVAARLYDIGCYAIARRPLVLRGEPERVAASIDRDPGFGTDRTTSGVLDFGGGRHLAFAVSTQSSPYQRVQLIGTTGRIEIEIPFNAPPDRACRYFIDDGSALDGTGMRVVESAPADQYQLQAEAFSHAIRNDPPNPAGLDEAVAANAGHRRGVRRRVEWPLRPRGLMLVTPPPVRHADRPAPDEQARASTRR